MKIVDPSCRLEARDEWRGGLRNIELAARNCYKSEDKITEGSAERIVRKLIERKHEAMLEHGDYIFEVLDEHVYKNVCEGLQIVRDFGCEAPMIATTALDGRYLVSGNIRAWRELIACSLAGAYFARSIDPIYLQGLNHEGVLPDPRIRQVRYEDLTPMERRAHERMTIRWIVDRGISHEIVRHRKASYAQESTRYANYSQDKFGREITVVKPSFLAEGSDAYTAWKESCELAESSYFKILEIEGTPEKARTVLPTSLKTELVMTASIDEWRHFFALRALGAAGRPHPQMQEVALPLYEMLKIVKPEMNVG